MQGSGHEAMVKRDSVLGKVFKVREEKTSLREELLL